MFVPDIDTGNGLPTENTITLKKSFPKSIKNPLTIGSRSWTLYISGICKNARCSGDANLECYLRLRAVRGQLYRVGDGKSRK